MYRERAKLMSKELSCAEAQSNDPNGFLAGSYCTKNISIILSIISIRIFYFSINADEDPSMNQYWYSPRTIQRIVNDIEEQGGRVGNYSSRY
jgi:hypothetical protein